MSHVCVYVEINNYNNNNNPNIMSIRIIIKICYDVCILCMYYVFSYEQ